MELLRRYEIIYKLNYVHTDVCAIDSSVRWPGDPQNTQFRLRELGLVVSFSGKKIDLVGILSHVVERKGNIECY